MNRRTAPIVAIVVAVAVVGLIGVAAAGPVGTAVGQDAPETNETGSGENATVTGSAADSGDSTAVVSPGERFSGVVGVQRAEIDGEVSSRSFEIALNQTDSEAERAEIVAERVNQTDDRLAAIERRQQELRERRAAGELSQGGFAARMAETGARAEGARREANRSADVAEELPEAARTQRGLDEERLNAVRERASELSGPEVAAIARGIAGNETGSPLAADRRGPPDRAANDSDRDRGQPGATDPGVGRGNGTPPANATNAGPPATGGPAAAGGPQNATGEAQRSPANDAPEPANASTTDRSDPSRESDGDSRSQNGSAQDGESESDSTPGNDGSDRDSTPGNDGSGEPDGNSGAGDSTQSGGADGGSSPGGDATSGRNRPTVGPVGVIGSFLRNAWSTAGVIGVA